MPARSVSHQGTLSSQGESDAACRYRQLGASFDLEKPLTSILPQDAWTVVMNAGLFAHCILAYQARPCCMPSTYDHLCWADCLQKPTLTHQPLQVAAPSTSANLHACALGTERLCCLKAGFYKPLAPRICKLHHDSPRGVHQGFPLKP